MDDMLTQFGGLGVLTPGALILLVALMVFTGRLVPKSVHESALARADKERKDMEHERDLWKETAESKDITIYTQAQSIRDLMAVGQTAERVINALPEAK